MSLKKQALAGVKWTFIQQLGTQGIGFIISIVLARLLLPEDFGLIAMITVFIAIGNVLLNSGLGSSLIRRQHLDEEDYSTVFYFNLLVSILIYMLTYWAAPYIANFYQQPILTQLIRWLGLTFIINAFAVIQQTRLTKLMDFKTQAIIAIPSLIIGGSIGVLMAYLQYGVWSLIAYNLIKNLVNTLQLWFYSKWQPLLKFNIAKFKQHFHFGYKLTLSGLLDTIFNNAYNIVIGKFFPVSDVGYYQRAKTLEMYPVGTLSAIMGKVSYPLFAQIQDDNVRLKSVYKKILQMNIFLIAPVLMISGVLAKPLFRFLFTDKWLPAVPYFQILLITGILYPIHA
ncbi:MAG TPA: lipopolysaccharide biosynthesis protein, partial [Flavobacteriales bacterium]|nr:lipopolysaccharide biosynthesis protein [Flavobacteriales bacterium]